MTYETDNRWAPLGSGMVPPDDAPACYGARWIDMGDHALADIVPDRQGFAYNTKPEMEALIMLMGKAGDSLRTPHKIGLDRDVTTVVMNTPYWKCYMRRSGGYIYVDAWLVPSATCKHCERRIVRDEWIGYWVDPEATGDDAVWRETCDAHDTFEAEHEPGDES